MDVELVSGGGGRYVWLLLTIVFFLLEAMLNGFFVTCSLRSCNAARAGLPVMLLNVWLTNTLDGALLFAGRIAAHVLQADHGYNGTAELIHNQDRGFGDSWLITLHLGIPLKIATHALSNVLGLAICVDVGFLSEQPGFSHHYTCQMNNKSEGAGVGIGHDHNPQHFHQQSVMNQRRAVDYAGLSWIIALFLMCHPLVLSFVDTTAFRVVLYTWAVYMALATLITFCLVFSVCCRRQVPLMHGHHHHHYHHDRPHSQRCHSVDATEQDDMLVAAAAMEGSADCSGGASRLGGHTSGVGGGGCGARLCTYSDPSGRSNSIGGDCAIHADLPPSPCISSSARRRRGSTVNPLAARASSSHSSSHRTKAVAVLFQLILVLLMMLPWPLFETLHLHSSTREAVIWSLRRQFNTAGAAPGSFSAFYEALRLLPMAFYLLQPLTLLLFKEVRQRLPSRGATTRGLRRSVKIGQTRAQFRPLAARDFDQYGRDPGELSEIESVL